MLNSVGAFVLSAGAAGVALICLVASAPQVVASAPLAPEVSATIVGGLDPHPDHKCITPITCVDMAEGGSTNCTSGYFSPCVSVPCVYSCADTTSTGGYCKPTEFQVCSDGVPYSLINCGEKHKGNCPRAPSGSDPALCVGGLCFDRGVDGTCGTMWGGCQ